MLTLLVILAILLQIAIAIGVYYRRRGGSTNTIFMLLNIALAGWAFMNYIAITIPQKPEVIYAIRTIITFVVIQNTLFYLFAKTFPRTKLRQLPKYNKFLLAYSVLVVLITQTPFLFQSVTIKNNTANPNPGPLIILFMVHAILTITLGLRALYHKYKNAVGQPRRQLLFILFASIILWLIVPITNFAITLSAKTTIFVKMSPFYTLLFGGFITYAIVAQKLFDIRSAVARSVAYLLLLATMATVYSVGLFGIVNVLLKDSSNEVAKQLLSVALITPLILGFQPIKRFFDRITNKLFYRDNYDLQEVLDKLGNLIVVEIDLQKVLNGTRTTLSGALKSSFIEFILFRGDNVTFETNHRTAVQANIHELINHIKEQRKDLLVTEELSPQSPFRQWFAEDNVALSLRLKTQHQVVGYILFGGKQSGDIYSTKDEKLLTIVANELAITIQNALRFEEIEKFNLTLQEKITTATYQLRRTNEKLKELDESKDEFISMASHQLRTPLTSVKGYLSMVLDGDVGKLNEKQSKLLDQAFISSQRMVYLIADLLNVSRLKTGKFVIEAGPTNLADVIEGELNQIKETAKGRNLELTYNKPKSFPELMLDETKIRQVVMNFADNAIYYTPSGGHISVELEDKGETVEFRVVDDGLGVPKHEQHQLFGKFYRAGNARKARPDGTGLGLFMAKKVVVAQGGSIIFSSEEGKGSTFGFVFAKSKLVAPDATLKTS